MMRFNYPVPNGKIYGASLKIQNLSSVEVKGLYADAGVFITYNDGSNGEFPLVTAGENGIITIPPNATVWIHRTEPIPWQPNARCELAVDSTSLPNSCLLTPVIKLGVVVNENPGSVV